MINKPDLNESNRLNLIRESDSRVLEISNILNNKLKTEKNTPGIKTQMSDNCMNNNSKTKFYEFFINNTYENIHTYEHISNKLNTSKYNIFTFIPYSLIIQFNRLPNIYFLICAIIQCFPILSPLNPLTSILPLVIVLGISMIRELFEDIERTKYDKINNKEVVLKLFEDEFKDTYSQDLYSGDLILLKKDEFVPCDCFILDSELKEGVCYAETSSIDGEKTLKEKKANIITSDKFKKYLTDDNHFKRHLNISGNVICDKPNTNIHKLDGKVKITINENTVEFPISQHNVLLKRAVIKHTNWVLCCAIYTGSNNKILMNTKKPKTKISKLEKYLNKSVYFICIFLFLLCVICALLNYKYYNNNQQFIKIIIKSNDEKASSFLHFFTYLLLLNTFIPISLVVTMEIVKVIQGLFIHWDVDLYCDINKKLCKVNSVSLNEELGNVNYIFSDKTGTLTCNQMDFRYCIIGSVCYEYNKGLKERVKKTNINPYDNNELPNENHLSINNKKKKIFTYSSNNLVTFKQQSTELNKNEQDLINNSSNIGFLPRTMKKISALKRRSICSCNTDKMILNINSNLIKQQPVTFGDSYFTRVLNYNRNKDSTNSPKKGNMSVSNKALTNFNFLKSSSMSPQNADKSRHDSSKTINKDDCKVIDLFWKALAVAHECICTTEDNVNPKEYSGISTDDIEIVKTAESQGYVFLKSDTTKRRLKINNEFIEYKILKILPFSSERRRMSIIIRDDNNKIRMYIKGADVEIKERLSKKSTFNHYKATQDYVNFFSRKGFRCLMVGTKILEENEFNIWIDKLNKSEMDLIRKKELINKCYEEIEKEFVLLGATVVEDKLQNQIPETIKELRLANIKIWVLTGDKIDTAENIALSSNLISKKQKNFKIVNIDKKEKKDEKNNDIQPQSKRENKTKDCFQEFYLFFKEYIEFLKFEQEKYEYYSDNNSNSQRYKNYDINYHVKNTNKIQDINYSLETIEEIEQILIDNKNQKVAPFSIIIGATPFIYIMSDTRLIHAFLLIAHKASSVVCCRLSPSQKSQVVKLVKDFDKNCITLSIGDGNNDVAMIREAHIGIGIYGNEGLAAVQASDFAIGEFKCLRRLLFFHGRINLIRMSTLIIYFFYKNCVFSIAHFVYGFYCLFSGQTIIDDWFITLFNLVFTSIPLAVQGVTDIDLDDGNNKYSDEHKILIHQMMPFLYDESRDKPIFNYKHFILCCIKGLLFGIFNILLIIYSFKNITLNEDGITETLWTNSLLINTNNIFGVSLVLLVGVSCMNYILPIIMFITTFLLYILFLIIVHYNMIFNSFASIQQSIELPSFYLILFLYTSLAFLVEIVYFHYQFYFVKSIKNTLINYIYKQKNTDEENILPSLIVSAQKNIENITKFNDISFLKDLSPYGRNSPILKKGDSKIKIYSNKIKAPTPKIKPIINEKKSCLLNRHIQAIIFDENNIEKKPKKINSVVHTIKRSNLIKK